MAGSKHIHKSCYNLYIQASVKYLLTRASRRLNMTQIELARKIANKEIDFEELYNSLDLRDRERIRFLREIEKEFSFKAVFAVRTDDIGSVKRMMEMVEETIDKIVERFYQEHEDLIASMNLVSSALSRIQKEDRLTSRDKLMLSMFLKRIENALGGDEQ